LPILSILLNNFSMAIELKVMPISTKKYQVPTSPATTLLWRVLLVATANVSNSQRILSLRSSVGSPQRRKEKPALPEFTHPSRPRSLAFNWLTRL
jgi:hypothetical protein